MPYLVLVGSAYDSAHASSLISEAAHVRRPRLDYESHATALDRNELGALLVAAGLGPLAEHALSSLLALNGLRVSEATGADIEHLGLERGHRTLVITRKGGKVVTIPLAPRTARGGQQPHPGDYRMWPTEAIMNRLTCIGLPDPGVLRRLLAASRLAGFLGPGQRGTLPGPVAGCWLTWWRCPASSRSRPAPDGAR
jgi:hypothetical protein